MISVKLNSLSTINIMRKVACKCLSGDYDLLLACRDLADIAKGFSGDLIDGMDLFIGVASEVDGLPLGEERNYWSAEALKSKDVEVSVYREQVRDTVLAAMRELLWALNTRRKELGAI